jgi:hypothetical protein
MVGNKQGDDLHREIAEAINRLDAALEGGTVDILEDRTLSLAVAKAMRVTLAAVGGSLGECRKTTPFSALFPVITSDGTFEWCCNHVPPHCVRS